MCRKKNITWHGVPGTYRSVQPIQVECMSSLCSLWYHSTRSEMNNGVKEYRVMMYANPLPRAYLAFAQYKEILQPNLAIVYHH